MKPDIFLANVPAHCSNCSTAPNTVALATPQGKQHGLLGVLEPLHQFCHHSLMQARCVGL